IVIAKLLALQLTEKAQKEVQRARLSLVLPQERLIDILPDAPGGAVIELPDFAFDVPKRVKSAGLRDRPRLPFGALHNVGEGGASNAWAATGARSASGAPLLATDPHLGLTAPSQFMLARLELESGGVIGATVPGLPGIVIGRNSSFGWGATVSYLDDQDLYYEKLDPNNEEMYLTSDGYKPFRSRETIIGIDDDAQLRYRLRWTERGPVLPRTVYDLDKITPKGHVISLAWTALDPDDRTIEGLLKLMRAQSVAQARDTAALILAPSLNLVMADADGIAMQTAGRVPRRRSDHTSQGRLPSPGWIEANHWDGYFPFEDNPFVENPGSGIVVNTNNKIADAPFPRHFSLDWGDDLRIRRAQRLLNAREFHTLDSFVEIQTDTVSPAARILLPLIARDLWYAGEPAEKETVPRRRQIALELLAGWNGDMSEHDPQPLIYAAWVRALQRRLAIDELGAAMETLKRPDPVFLERVFRDVDGAAVWCDIKQTSRRETCQDMARLALDDALIFLSEEYGTRPESWRWGDAHRALHEHTVFSRVPGLAWFANIWQDMPGGDHTLMRAETIGTGSEPFTAVHGSAFRAVYDFSDPDSSVFVLSTGESGHLLSRHYDDLAVLWRRREYIPMSLDPVLARGNAVGITRLAPNGGAPGEAN
ncbi:MAG: penicillin acylase family protein, partial [Paracoccaceae bacterium]